jgi:16S rRNA (cytosine1402-N4)-methyltransferase
MGLHRPVLLREVLEALRPRAGGVYVDCTFGRGGHAGALLEQVGPGGRVIGLDRDPEAAAAARRWAQADPRLIARTAPFSALAREAEALGVAGAVDGVLFDLGVSSPQLDAPERGFSFLRDGPLDMRMDPTAGPSAAEWVNAAAQAEIARVLRDYGEEPEAGRIAAAIVRARPLSTTRELAETVERALPRGVRDRDRHPATLTFQAIRIFLNRELEELESALPQCLEVLRPGGRLAVISFHSLEDRRVKRFIRDQARGDPFPRDLPVAASALHPRLRPVGRAVHAGEEEVAANPRARSAVLRVAETLG